MDEPVLLIMNFAIKSKIITCFGALPFNEKSVAVFRAISIKAKATNDIKNDEKSYVISKELPKWNVQSS